MSVRQQVEDATFLVENGRHLGALAILMLAVAASSRRTFPKGVSSIEQPKEPMGDREAFKQFLGGRIRRLLFGAYGSPEFGSSGISVGFKGKDYDVAYILYKFYRCALVHEGELPDDIEFSPPSQGSGLTVSQPGLSVSISSGDTLILDHGWIPLLLRAVVEACCNGKEFGIQHFDLVPNFPRTQAEIEAAIVAKYSITPGRFAILREVVRHATPENVANIDDHALNEKFVSLCGTGVVNGGAITGLASRGLASHGGLLLPKGVAALREIASSYSLVEV